MRAPGSACEQQTRTRLFMDDATTFGLRRPLWIFAKHLVVTEKQKTQMPGCGPADRGLAVRLNGPGCKWDELR